MPSERVQRRIDRLLDQAEEAVEAFKKYRPILTLIEFMMPKKAGLEVCRDLRHSPEGSHSLLVVMSSPFRGRQFRADAVRVYGATETIEKPVNEEKLQDLLERLVRPHMAELDAAGPNEDAEAEAVMDAALAAATMGTAAAPVRVGAPAAPPVAARSVPDVSVVAPPVAPAEPAATGKRAAASGCSPGWTICSTRWESRSPWPRPAWTRRSSRRRCPSWPAPPARTRACAPTRACRW